MSKLSYWERRQVQDAYEHFQKAEDTADQISNLYLKASRYLSIQADEIFERYRSKHGLSEAEARRLLAMLRDKESLDGLLWLLKNSEENKKKKELIILLESPAYQARLERLQQMQNQLDLLMKDIYHQEKAFNTSFYTDLANESYYRSIFNIQQQADVAFSFNHVSAKIVDRVINSRWSGKNYSERIWRNVQGLAKSLKEELLINLVTGRTNREAAEIIEAKFGQGANKARRIVWTESAYVSGELNAAAYEECNVEKYRYLATLDLRTSKVCRGLDGKPYLLSDRKVGVNYPPMHPYCRSTTISYIDEEKLKEMKRAARDPVTGKSVKVPATMTYEEWYNKYVKGDPAAEVEQKKIRNLSSDRGQHQKYRDILGDEVPKSFAKFQEMKYNNSERWGELKEAYRDVNWQRKAIENSHTSGTEHKVPSIGVPNSAYDKMDGDKIVQRRYYGKTGKPRLDIDLTDHGNPVKHPIVPHRHGWKELQDGGIKREEKHDMPLKLGDKIANKDILKGMISNDSNR